MFRTCVGADEPAEGSDVLPKYRQRTLMPDFAHPTPPHGRPAHSVRPNEPRSAAGDLSGTTASELQALGTQVELQKQQLAELRHRIANHLQLATSLVQLQADQLAEGSMHDQLDSALSRLKALAMLWHHVCAADGDDRVDLAGYAEQLSESLISAHTRGRPRIRVQLDAARISLGVKQATPWALILHELMSNALQHGLKPAGGGTLTVRVRRDSSGSIVSSVGDDSSAPFDGIDTQGASTLGLRIVRALTVQLGGCIKVDATTREVSLEFRGEEVHGDLHSGSRG